MRHSIDLSGPWQFQPDPAQEGVHRRWFDPTHDARLWRAVEAPVSFDLCMPELEAYEGDGWYRRAFSAPDDWRCRRIDVCFAGVSHVACVWVNGVHVGDHGDPYLPFAFDVTPHVRFGETNTLIVRIDNLRRKGEAPGMQRGWCPVGGLLREVTLLATHATRLEHLRVVAEPDGSIAIRAETTGDGVVAAHVLRGERELAQFAAKARGGIAEIAGQVTGVSPWSPDEPNLYNLRVTLTAAGAVVDEQTLRIGFRRIEARGVQVLLNGEPIHLVGFNRHEDSPRRGMCPDLDTARQDFLGMKAAGANFVRHCHYPHHPGELDLCDEIGLLAMGEIPLMWWDGATEGDDHCAHKVEAASRQLTAMIRRDVNHPAVIFWSVSNETHEQRPEVIDGNHALLNLARSLDPTRLVTHASNRWREGQAARKHMEHEADPTIAATGRADGPGSDTQFTCDDVICVNGYPLLNARAYGGDHDYLPQRAADAWRDQLADLHRRYPDKPIMVSEFGHVALEGVFRSNFGEDAQAEAIVHEAAGMIAPYICGLAIWCWADHPMPQSGFCRNLRLSPYGICTRSRKRLLAYDAVRKLFHQLQANPHAPFDAAALLAAGD